MLRNNIPKRPSQKPSSALLESLPERNLDSWRGDKSCFLDWNLYGELSAGEDSVFTFIFTFRVSIGKILNSTSSLIVCKRDSREILATEREKLEWGFKRVRDRQGRLPPLEDSNPAHTAQRYNLGQASSEVSVIELTGIYRGKCIL